MYDEWDDYNPFDESDSEDEDEEYMSSRVYRLWFDIRFDHDPNLNPFIESNTDPLPIPDWMGIIPVFEDSNIEPSDQLIKVLATLSIADIQRASGLKAAGVLPENIIKEMRLLLPGTATQQLCQLAGIVDYEDSRRD